MQTSCPGPSFLRLKPSWPSSGWLCWLDARSGAGSRAKGSCSLSWVEKKRCCECFFPLRFVLDTELHPKAWAVTPCGTCLTMMVYENIKTLPWRTKTPLFFHSCPSDPTKHCHVVKIQYLFLIMLERLSNFRTFAGISPRHHPPQSPGGIGAKQHP